VKAARRRKARELLVQALYAAELGHQPLAQAVADQIERRRPHEESLEYIHELASRLSEHVAERDARIDAVIESRAPERVGTVERCILRLGVAELEFRSDVPTAVILDEAMGLVRHFASEDSARFVHGVLDRIGRELRPAES
jgi:N utilization substance protein B